MDSQLQLCGQGKARKGEKKKTPTKKKRYLNSFFSFIGRTCPGVKRFGRSCGVGAEARAGLPRLQALSFFLGLGGFAKN